MKGKGNEDCHYHTGRLKPEQADKAASRTSTTLADFARETMLSLMPEKVTR
jgi:hypothetical protein